ncbi:MAG: sporulation protein YabP [Oscillospiraceae bacterium]|jgi:sporulation protein YabP|nr:sporulation protein YabP [Oscillospiraceae bacterium]
MTEAAKTTVHNHALILDNRQNLTMTGVTDVAGFDEQTINVSTDFGGLVIKGTKLHINKLSLETGEVSVDGNITSLQYLNSGATKQKGFVSKLLK